MQSSFAPTMSSQRDFPRFINDLVPLILESEDSWWPRHLCRLALVSSVWLGPVQRVLYRSPTLYAFRSCVKLAQSLSDNEALQPLIKYLDMRPTSEELLDGRVGPGDFVAIRHLLRLDGLRSITLGGLLSVGAERFLQTIAYPELIEKVHIDGCSPEDSPNSQPSLEWGETLACMFCNLKKLCLTNVELDIIPSSIPYTLQLTDLELIHTNIIGGFLKQLLHETTSVGRLRIVTGKPMDEQITTLLESCSVGTLEYEVERDTQAAPTEIFAANTPTLGALRCLQLKGMMIDLETLNLITERCRGLEGLCVGGRGLVVGATEWTEMMGGLPRSLQRLALPLEIAVEERVRAAAGRRGIKLVEL